MEHIPISLKNALNIICGLTEFELDRSERMALKEALPLFESSYSLLIILEEIIDMSSKNQIDVNKIKNLICYAKSGFANESKI